eukprot:GILI01003894.1.p1 GENE.GILI01003894.1~~GILI01003894.1.p1  ORF type:complete len:576 (+),score=101.25 GILI01003894.1:80-1807(+)
MENAEESFSEQQADNGEGASMQEISTDAALSAVDESSQAELAPSGDNTPADRETMEPLSEHAPATSEETQTSTELAIAPEGEGEVYPSKVAVCDVTFTILPENYREVRQVDIQEPVHNLRLMLSEDLKIPFESLLLANLTTEDGTNLFTGQLPDQSTLESLGVSEGLPGVHLQLQIKFFDRPKTVIEYKMPDIIDVELHYTNGEVRVIKVEVERPAKPKSYLGGYRNKHSGIEYHHAYTQTMKKAEQKPLRNHRETQTFFQNTRSQQTKREQGTQMLKTGVFVDPRTDRVLYPQPYKDSSQWFAERLEKTLYIQCAIRGWFARRRAEKLKEARDERIRKIIEEEETRRREAEDKHKKEIERRMHPRTAADFELLYSELEAWRLAEIDRIRNSTMNEEERKVSMDQLLQKETKLLQTIDKLKITANKSNKETKTTSQLSKMASAKMWQRQDGNFTEVHTPFTIRAKELMDLYNGLKMRMLSIDERLDVLLHVKWTVKEFDCNLTREIVDLIDREADMLNRGRQEKTLSGLRQRLNNLFLQFIETPEFNPEATRFQKVPRDFYRPSNIRPILTNNIA